MTCVAIVQCSITRPTKHPLRSQSKPRGLQWPSRVWCPWPTRAGELSSVRIVVESSVSQRSPWPLGPASGGDFRLPRGANARSSLLAARGVCAGGWAKSSPSFQPRHSRMQRLKAAKLDIQQHLTCIAMTRRAAAQQHLSAVAQVSTGFCYAADSFCHRDWAEISGPDDWLPNLGAASRRIARASGFAQGLDVCLGFCSSGESSFKPCSVGTVAASYVLCPGCMIKLFAVANPT